MTTFIYTLSDPRTNEIRYIGKANNISKRLFSHLQGRRKISYGYKWKYKLAS